MLLQYTTINSLNTKPTINFFPFRINYYDVVNDKLKLTLLPLYLQDVQNLSSSFKKKTTFPVSLVLSLLGSDPIGDGIAIIHGNGHEKPQFKTEMKMEMMTMMMMIVIVEEELYILYYLILALILWSRYVTRTC